VFVFVIILCSRNKAEIELYVYNAALILKKIPIINVLLKVKLRK
jgi:hypothetical protein